MKKILKFILVVLLLFPLNGCMKVETFPNVLDYESDENDQLVNNKVYYFVGHCMFLNTNYRIQFDNYLYTDFYIAMKIDDNTDYHTKYIVPDKDILDMKYYIDAGHSYNDAKPSGFKKASKYEFDLSNIDVQNKIIFHFNYEYVGFFKETYEYEILVSCKDNKITVKDIHYRLIHISFDYEQDLDIKEFY